MTPQEAIGRLNSTKEYLEENYQEDVKNCKYPELKPLIKQTYEENIMGFNIAISVLEKQIPKKPIKSDRQEIRYTLTYDCPTCGRQFTGTGFADYCYHCGQALDWSDDK